METTEIAAAHSPAEAPDTNSRYHQLIVFKLGEEEYGIYIDQIKEVVFTPHITRMPQTPSYLKGVANIRGNILAIVDLEKKFGLQTTVSEIDEGASNYTLVAESKDFTIGILVKEVPNTLTVSSNDIDETVNVVQGTQEEHNYIKGIAKVNDRLIILIDVFTIMQEKEMNRVLAKESASNYVAG
uniref:Chemotaxis protein CheW n=1 Tax=Roseihalotalea indica TaxID=2867963 RepID=A0AA49JG16_9BACT|nr:chemotaxis protein CheW [Tunicatimonas sp. TK19036]